VTAREGLVETLGLGFGIWDLGFGIWDLGFGIWDLGFGIWDLGFVGIHIRSHRIDILKNISQEDVVGTQGLGPGDLFRVND
jgi:hypothetical protein